MPEDTPPRKLLLSRRVARGGLRPPPSGSRFPGLEKCGDKTLDGAPSRITPTRGRAEPDRLGLRRSTFAAMFSGARGGGGGDDAAGPDAHLSDLFSRLHQSVEDHAHKRASKLCDEILKVSPGDADASRAKVVALSGATITNSAHSARATCNGLGC